MANFFHETFKDTRKSILIKRHSKISNAAHYHTSKMLKDCEETCYLGYFRTGNILIFEV